MGAGGSANVARKRRDSTVDFRDKATGRPSFKLSKAQDAQAQRHIEAGVKHVFNVGVDDEFDAAFYRVDKDKSGFIDVHELHSALGTLGIQPDSFQHTLEVMREFDKDKTGGLELKEFRSLARRMKEEMIAAEGIFKRFDKNGDQRIGVMELCACLTHLHLADNLDQAKAVMETFSVEKKATGTLSFDEFNKAVDRCRALKSHRETFRSYDANGDGTIDVAELLTMLLDLGLANSEVQARDVLQIFDIDGNRSLDVAEFIKLADSLAIFHEFDRNLDGKLGVHDLHYLLQKLKIASDFETTKTILKRWDKNGEGCLQFNEYLMLNKEIQELTKYLHVPYCNGTCGCQCNPANQRPQAQAAAPAPSAPGTPRNLNSKASAPSTAAPQSKASAPAASATKRPSGPPAKLPALTATAPPPLATTINADEIFRKFDRDGDSSIDVYELHGALEGLGLPPNNFFHAIETMRRYDDDGDGKLQLDGFRQLAAEVLRKLQETDSSFVQFDADRDGRISTRELVGALVALNLQQSAVFAPEVIRQFSSDGTLQLPEYRKVVHRCRALDKHVTTFRFYDKDGSGGIDAGELHAALNELGLLTSLDQAREVLLRFDSDENGVLDVREFSSLVDTISTFRQFDRNGDGTLDVQELHYALITLRVPMATFQQTKEMHRYYDKEGTGALSVSQYLELIYDLQTNSRPPANQNA
jgi:Ca2+-binding EF-hand superfamily protein